MTPIKRINMHKNGTCISIAAACTAARADDELPHVARPRDDDARAACDVLAEIPLRGPAESLNASVAAGVALFASFMLW